MEELLPGLLSDKEILGMKRRKNWLIPTKSLTRTHAQAWGPVGAAVHLGPLSLSYKKRIKVLLFPSTGLFLYKRNPNSENEKPEL